MRAFRSKSVFLLLALATIGCQNTDLLQPLPATSGQVSSIAITRAAPSLLIGQSAQLAAAVLDGSGNAIPNPPVAWSSSDTRIATISATGLIAGIAIGTVTVSATSGDKTANTTVSIGSSVAHGDTTAGAAIQPQLYATAMPAVTGKTITVPSNGDLQAALDAAQPGDVVQLTPGATYSGNFVLRNKNTTSTDWIIIRPAIADASLPAEGSRMTPQLAATLQLPRVLSPNSQPAFQTPLGAHHYRLVALEVGVDQSQALNYGIITLGVAGDGGQTTLASVPHDLVIDRSYVHGSPTLNLSRCVALNSAYSAVIDSYLSECHQAGGDAQAVAGWNGPGPFKIVNNYLEGSAENILFGGADPSIPDLIPSDIEIRHNHVTKPLAWRGGSWQIKNLLELKNAQRVLIEGNVFENNWEQAQDGSAMQLQSTNQSGGALWSRTWDVTIRSNIIRNTGGGIVIAGAPQVYPAVHARRFTLSNNLIQNVNVPGFAGTGRALSLFQDVADVMIVHNTIPATTNSAITFDGSVSAPTIRLLVRDNIMGGGAYGITGSGTGGGLPSWQAWAPDGTFLNNVLIMDLAGSVYPSNNFYPASPSAVGFESFSTGDFRLSLVSPFKSKGTDGRDIGVDMDVLLTAVSGVVVP
jgi:Bacterial Ig-like domain (group 2)/Right handed beta helix region